MPKLKLKGWQFMLMYDALLEKCQKEKQKFYEFLRQFSDEDFANTDETVKQKKESLLNTYNKLMLDYSRKIEAIRLAPSETLTPSAMEQLKHFEIQLAQIEKLSIEINEKYDYISELEKIAKLLLDKSNDKDFWPYYDDTDKKAQ